MELESSSNFPTASEAIWGNFDIMEKIFGFLHEREEDNLNPSSPSVSSRKDLLSACLISKSFFLEPGLTILWRHLNSLMPVLRLFPTFREDDFGNTLSLTGTVRHDHLQRVLFYSRRIRSIRIVSPPTVSDALTILSSRMQPLQPFLPLTELIVEITPVKNILDPILFIMPLTLTTISITGISAASRVAVASLLQHLSSNHDSLNHLSLIGSLDDAFLSILLECTSLRSLTLKSSETGFSSGYLRDLSDSLTSLETLSLNRLRYGPAFNAVSPGASLPPAVFASLLELTLTGDLPSISGILSTLKAPLLREITLSFSSLIEVDTPDAVTFAGCVAQVSKINGLERKGNLRSVKISHTDPSTCINMSQFDALYALRTTIQVLHLHPNQLHIEGAKEYKNPIGTRLVYPHLVDLRLSYKAFFLPNGVHCTPMILTFLSSSCPNLETLHLSIHVDDEDQIKRRNTRNTPARPIHRLQNLVFHHLPITWNFTMTLAVAFARYLNYIFPMLSTAEYCEEGMSEEVKEWWTGVQEMLKMCQGEESARRLAASNT